MCFRLSDRSRRVLLGLAIASCLFSLQHLAGHVLVTSIVQAEQAWRGREEYKGHLVQIDLPWDQHVRNIQAPADKLGLCVFASLDSAARWHNIRPLIGIINKLQYGAGWPAKVDQVMQKYAPDVKYIQYEGTDLTLLDRALAANHIACVTYGYGENYTGTIAHMVNLVYLDDEYAAILDNNRPEEYSWMTREEFRRRWTWPSGQGWAVVLLTAPPPPVPSN